MACIVEGTTVVYMQRCLHGDSDMLKVHVHVHETRFTAQNICLSHSSTKDPGKVSMHAQASALWLHGCAFAMGVYFTENTGFDSCTCTCTWTLQRWISMHGKSMCPMRRPMSRIHVHHQNDQDPGKFHIPRLHCIFALRCVLCYPGTSESVSFRLAPECSALPSYETWHTCSSCSWLQSIASDFLIFPWGLSYGLQSRKTGKNHH